MFLYMVPVIIHKIANLILIAIPMLFIKSYTIYKYVFLQISANYCNNIIFGKYESFCFFFLKYSLLLIFSAFLVTLYPNNHMDLYCVLSALPDCIIELPVTLFILEYQKKKAELIKELKTKQTKSEDNSTNSPPEYKINPLSIIPIVILNVIFNPIIWGMFLGFICNFVFDSYPLFFTTTVNYIAQSSYAACMFTVGLYLFADC